MLICTADQCDAVCVKLCLVRHHDMIDIYSRHSLFVQSSKNDVIDILNFGIATRTFNTIPF